MINLHRYPHRPPVHVSGPYRTKLKWPGLAISVIGHAAIGAVLAYAVVGMTGALDEEKPLQLACIQCAGGVR